MTLQYQYFVMAVDIITPMTAVASTHYAVIDLITYCCVGDGDARIRSAASFRQQLPPDTIAEISREQN
jgi:hypothetical protein